MKEEKERKKNEKKKKQDEKKLQRNMKLAEKGTRNVIFVQIIVDYVMIQAIKIMKSIFLINRNSY